MLEMREVCERCDIALAADSSDAFICSYECTWCRGCAEGTLAGRCPNCSGILQVRPTRRTG